MLYTNPNIIQTQADAIIGCIETDMKEMSMLEYTLKVENRLMKIIHDSAIHEVNDSVNYSGGLDNLLEKIHSYLHFDEKKYPKDVEGIVKELMNSYEFSHWSNQIYYRFMNLHKDVIVEDTPVPVGGRNIVFEDFDVKSVDIYEVLQALSAVFTLTN
jgi:hypothetical protein